MTSGSAADRVSHQTWTILAPGLMDDRQTSACQGPACVVAGREPRLADPFFVGTRQASESCYAKYVPKPLALEMIHPGQVSWLSGLENR